MRASMRIGSMVLSVLLSLLLVAEPALAAKKGSAKRFKMVRGKHGLRAVPVEAPVAEPANAPPPAPLPPATPEAKAASKQHFKAGEGLFAQNKYQEAIVEYQAAWDAWALEGFFFNIAQCYRNLGQIPEAIDYFERYMKGSNVKNRDEVESVLVELRQKQAAEKAQAEAVAAAEAEAKKKAAEPAPQPGSAAVVVVDPNRAPPSTTPEAEIHPAARPALVAVAAPAPRPVENEGAIYKKGWFWVVAGVVLVGVGAGIGIGAAVNSNPLPNGGSLGLVDWR